MKRKLLRQLRNEWQANIWLCLELLIVSVVIWYIADFFFVKTTLLTEPKGWSTERIYRIETTLIPAESPDYVASADGRAWWELLGESAITLVDRLKTNPDVEYATIVEGGGVPYDGSSSSNSLKDANPLPGDTINLESLDFEDEEKAPEGIPETGRRLSRMVYYVGMGKDALRAYDVHGLGGETPDELEAILDRGDILLSETAVNGTDRDPLSLIGRQFYVGRDSTRTYRVGAIIPYLNSAGDFSGIGDNVKWVTRNNGGFGTIIVRVRPGHEDGFADRIIAEADNYYSVNNLVIDNVQPIDEIGKEFDREPRLEMRNWFVCLGFMLMSIFLGVLGTFWFRTQQRMGEMAIRKTFGASSSALFRRLIGEGLVLLVCATVPAAVIDIIIANHELNAELYLVYMEPARMALTIAATFLFMAVMIVLGTVFPAWRAMKVDPARVLADE